MVERAGSRSTCPAKIRQALAGSRFSSGVQVVQPRARTLLAPGQVIVAIQEGGLLGEDLVPPRFAWGLA